MQRSHSMTDQVVGKQGGSIRPQMGKELKAFFDWCQTIVLLASGKWNSEQQNTIIWGQSKRSRSAPSWNTFGLFDPLRKKHIMGTLICFEKETKKTKILCFLFQVLTILQVYLETFLRCCSAGLSAPHAWEHSVMSRLCSSVRRGFWGWVRETVVRTNVDTSAGLHAWPLQLQDMSCSPAILQLSG